MHLLITDFTLNHILSISFSASLSAVMAQILGKAWAWLSASYRPSSSVAGCFWGGHRGGAPRSLARPHTRRGCTFWGPCGRVAVKLANRPSAGELLQDSPLKEKAMTSSKVFLFPGGARLDAATYLQALLQL